MAQANLERNTFVRGLITEASPLTFPENASIDEDNFVLNREGSRQRRLGMDYEPLHELVDTGKTSLTFDNHRLTAFRWNNVNNDATVSIGVIQVGNTLWFVDLFADVLSDNLLNGGVALTLNSGNVGTNISGNTPIQYVSANGVLIIVSKELPDPFYITYDSVGDSFSLTRIDIKVRDLIGVDDGLPIDERPTTLSDEHKYNLLNQGWTEDMINNMFTGAALNGFYPSNADIIYLTTKSTGTGYDFELLKNQYLGNSPAAKGKFIIDAFDRGSGRQEESGIGTLPADTDSGNISSVAFFAGRAFYSGISSTVTSGDSLSPNYSGFIFFTQILDNNDKLTHCYQQADPTSEQISDLISTDGGTIQIPEAANILRLVTKDTSLVVIAENGVWEITGPDGVFKADDFSISQITNIGAVNGESVVNAEGNILYWGDGGIYQLVADQVTGRLQASNITETTIQTYYNDITGIAKEQAIGTYDPASRRIRWLYTDDENFDGTTLVNKYNRELILDTVLGSFYTSTIGEIDTNSPFVAGYLTTPDFLSTDNTQAVVVNGEQVQVNGEDVVVTEKVRSRGVTQTKYLTIVPNVSGSNYGFTFSQYRNPDFLDWESADGNGVDAPAYLVGGFELWADSQRSKQANYLTVHLKRTETGFTEVSDGNLEAINQSSCLMRAQWDFADSANSGKWGTQFQAYRLTRHYFPSGPQDTFDYGQEVITTKNRLRGSGKALSLRVDSEAGKDLYLLGWAMSVEGRRAV